MKDLTGWEILLLVLFLIVLTVICGRVDCGCGDEMPAPQVNAGDATKVRCDEDCAAYAKHDTESRKRICAKYTEEDQMWYSTACDQPAWLDPKSFRSMYQPPTVMRPASCLCFAGHWKYPEMGVLW